MSIAVFADFVLSYATLETLGNTFSLLGVRRMDAKATALNEKLEFHLAQAAHVAAEIQAAEQGAGTPHYDQIELPAHALGQRFSRLIQTERAREIAASKLGQATCPECQRKCEVETKTRAVHAMDGPLELTETVAHCRSCRRSFFPSAYRTRV